VLVVALVVLLGVPRLFDPATWVLLQAVHDLGPISGWRCAHSATYVYDPSRENADSTLLSDAPEATVLANAPEVQIDHVEANLRGGDTSVWTLDAEKRRGYVLSPGRLQAITIDLNGGRTTICNAHLGDWHIIGEHQLD
jgi:hypothetical protein